MADITVHGNATAEAELKYTPSGSAVLNFDLAENHRKKQGDQFIDDGTTFYRVTAWGYLAEAMAGQIFKGTRVLVTGRFRGGEFTSRDGQQVRTYEVTANQCGVIPRGDQGGHPAPAQNQSMPPTTGGWGNQQPTGSPEWGGGNSETAPF